MHIRSKRVDRYALEHGLRVAGWLRYALSAREARLLPPGEHTPLCHEVKSILAIQLFALGDLVLTVPALEALRCQWPKARLTLLALPQLGALARRFEAVDEVLALRGVRDVHGMRRLHEGRYDLAVVFNPNLLGAWVALLAGARTKLGYVSDAEGRADQALGRVGPALLDLPVRPAADPCHETERYLALAAVVARRPASPKLALRLAGEDVAFAERFFRENGLTGRRPLLGIHPAAKWVSRRWLSDRMAAVADHAAQRLDAHVLFLGSRDEAVLVDSVRQRMRTPSVSAVGRTDLPQLASLIAACDLIVCHDSGPMHLASGFRVPTVAIFGPGDVTKFRPFHPEHRVARHPVWCNPCKVQFVAPCPNNVCMSGLEVAEVQRAVDDVVDRWVSVRVPPRRERLREHLLDRPAEGAAP